MKIIESALISAINKHPQIPLVIAYSGGVDSQVLLHALAELKHAQKIPNQITVCHVNHGLSDNAGSWQIFAQHESRKLNLPFVACQVNLQIQAQQSIEAIAREARYRALHSIYNERSLIITGHHRDDQAETFLLALKRGSGLKGLSAMATETTQDKDSLIRPLLNVSRADIVNYAKAQRLSWIEDESNDDTRFDRNFIRQEIMPLLTQRWPSITQTISRSSSHCLEGQLLLNELAEEDLIHCQLTECSLSVNDLCKLSTARFNNLLRHFLAKNHYLMPSTEQLAQVYQQLFADEDKTPVIKVANHYLRRYKKTLYLTKRFVDISAWKREISYFDEVRLIKGKAQTIELPDGVGKVTFSDNHFFTQSSVSNTSDSTNRSTAEQWVVLPIKGQQVTLCFTHSNPTCLPDYRQRSRSLKKILQELNIPPWQRKRIPFLYYDGQLVAAIGHFVCQPYLPEENELGVKISPS